MLSAVLLVFAHACAPGLGPDKTCLPIDGPFYTNGSKADLGRCSVDYNDYVRAGCDAAQSASEPMPCSGRPNCQNCYYQAQGCGEDCFRQPYNSLLDNQPRRYSSQDGLLEVDLHVAPCYKNLPLPVSLDGCSAGADARVVGTVGAWMWCYNGQMPGPTLIVKPGDKLVINLFNDMQDEAITPGQFDFNKDGRFNSTNLHVHGLYVSPLPSSDHIMVNVAPGSQFTYVFQIPPWHPTGTYWYHPHRHNSATVQVAMGLHGFLWVHDPAEAGALTTMPTVPLVMTSWLSKFTDSAGNNYKDQLKAHGVAPETAFNPAISCGNANLAFPFQNKPLGWGQTFACADYTFSAPKALSPPTLTSGMVNPRIELVSGKWYRFRMLNTGNGETQILWNFAAGKPSAVGCEAWVVARDGVHLRRARNIESYYISAAKPYSFFNFLSSAMRYDFAVRCVLGPSNKDGIPLSATTGSYDQRANETSPLNAGVNLDPIGYIAVLEPVAGTNQRCMSQTGADVYGLAASPTDECALLRAQPPFEMANQSLGADLGWRFAPTKDQPIRGSFEVNFSSVVTPWNAKSGYQPAAPQPVPANGGGPPVFNVNGFSFETTRLLHRAQLNTIEEWTLRNNDYLAFHIFHLHTWHFQVTSYTLAETMPFGVTLPGDFDFSDWWFDTLGLPTQPQTAAGTARTYELTGPGSSAVARIRFYEFVGELVFHCHVLSHEDVGMIALTTVADGKPVSKPRGTVAHPDELAVGVPNFFSYDWRPSACANAPRAGCERDATEGRCADPQFASRCRKACGLCVDAVWLERDRLTPFYVSGFNDTAGPDGGAVGPVTIRGSTPSGEDYELLLSAPDQVVMPSATVDELPRVFEPPRTNVPPWSNAWPLALESAARRSGAPAPAVGAMLALALGAAAVLAVAAVRRGARIFRRRMGGFSRVGAGQGFEVNSPAAGTELQD